MSDFDRPRAQSPWRTLILVMLAVWACLCLSLLAGVAAYMLVMPASQATIAPSAEPDPTTALPPATSTARPTSTSTRVPPATATHTATPHPATPTRPAGTAGPGATATPFVCAEPSDIYRLSVLPGQSFSCTLTEGYLNEQIQNVPDLPCQTAAVYLDEGELTVVCRMGFQLTATGEAHVQDCRVSVQNTYGTPGFAGLVEEMVNTQLAQIPYDSVCIESVVIADGEMTFSGYGR